MTENLSGVSTFSPEQVKILESRGISPEVATEFGVMGVQEVADLPPGMPDYWTRELGYLPGLLFRWFSPVTKAVEWQLRPDTAVASSDGSVRKYVFRKDAPSILNAAGNDARASDMVVITEGTCQTIAVAAHLPAGYAVYGIAGCQSWTKRGVPTADLAVVDGRDVLIALDADAATNRNVYDAGVALREACLADGATSVKFIRVPGGKKSGLDDVLAGQAPDRRTTYLARLFDQATNRPKAEKPEAPAATKPKPRKSDTAGDPDAEHVPGSAFFGDNGLRVHELANAIEDLTPVMLTAEQKVAVYGGGVFRLDPLAFSATLGALLLDLFRKEHRGNAEEYLAGRLYSQGKVLPYHQDKPLMNVLNGMVDLRTGKLKPHDPKYLSSVQFPVRWDPQATCPTYEQWLSNQAGDQVDALEETISALLDPSGTPQRAAFLFGKARSGKGTFLRILLAVAGQENTSAVDLAALSSDQFAAANVYGKVLNVSGDLPAMHVDDVSMFKKLTGQDLIQANRKFGGQFPFINKALFVFAGNELPTVGESSRAYVERIRPFEFDATFAGQENQAIEDAMMAELPGILARWVRAWQRRQERGAELPINDRIKTRFEVASDRVRQFLQARCAVDDSAFSTTTELHNAFKSWASDNGGSVLGKTKFADRLRQSPGINSARGEKLARGWNVRIKPTQEWDTEDVSEGTRMSPQTLPILAELAELNPIVGGSEANTFLDPKKGGFSIPPTIGLNSANSAKSPIDDIFTGLFTHGPTSCVDCGQELTLVDSTWYACSRCHPESARTDHPSSEA